GGTSRTAGRPSAGRDRRRERRRALTAPQGVDDRQHADRPVVRRKTIKAATLEQRDEKPDRPDPTRERERKAHREGHGPDGGDAHDHVTPLNQRRPRDHGNGEEEAEFGRRRGAETAPQRGA